MSTEERSLQTNQENSIAEKEKRGVTFVDSTKDMNLITNDHPWVGSPSFILTRNLEDSIRYFYQQQETDICFAAMRALLMDDESNFKRLKEKYKKLEEKIISEMQWAKDNPETIAAPQKVEYQEDKLINPGFKCGRAKPNPFFSAVKTANILARIDTKPESTKGYEVIMTKDNHVRNQILSGISNELDTLDPTSLWPEGEKQTKLQLEGLETLKIGGETESR